MFLRRRAVSFAIFGVGDEILVFYLRISAVLFGVTGTEAYNNSWFDGCGGRNDTEYSVRSIVVTFYIMNAEDAFCAQHAFSLRQKQRVVHYIITSRGTRAPIVYLDGA